MADPLLDRAPFDAAAGDYDRQFTDTALGRALRDSVWRVAEPALNGTRHVLELGCGTGADFERLAASGRRVSALDASASMCDAARRRLSGRPFTERVTVRRADLDALQLTGEESGADAVFSNFGVLNAVRDRSGLASTLARALPVGAPVVVVVMGPACLWEWAIHLARLRPRTAFRRFRSGASAHAGGGGTLPVWYPSPVRLQRDFAPHFDLVDLRAAGVALPPSYAARWWEERRRLRAATERMERRLQRVRAFAHVADHYVARFERSRR